MAPPSCSAQPPYPIENQGQSRQTKRRDIHMSHIPVLALTAIVLLLALHACGASAADNTFIEPLNGKFRAECLDAHWFLSRD